MALNAHRDGGDDDDDGDDGGDDDDDNDDHDDHDDHDDDEEWPSTRIKVLMMIECDAIQNRMPIRGRNTTVTQENHNQLYGFLSRCAVLDPRPAKWKDTLPNVMTDHAASRAASLAADSWA